MSKHTFEAPVFKDVQDKLHDAQQLSADQWAQPFKDAKHRLMGEPTDDERTAALVFNAARAVPDGFAAFAGQHKYESGWSDYAKNDGLGTNGRALAGIGVLMGAEYAIDKAFFNNNRLRGGTMLSDFAVTPLIMMATPMSMKYKVAASIGGHIIGKLIDKYAD
jgi:hypothetical protein